MHSAPPVRFRIFRAASDVWKGKFALPGGVEGGPIHPLVGASCTGTACCPVRAVAIVDALCRWLQDR